MVRRSSTTSGSSRSEERRVGKECRSRCDWSSDVCSSDLFDGNIAGFALMHIDEHIGALAAAHGAPLQYDQRVVRLAKQLLRPLLVQGRDRCLHCIDLRNAIADVEALGLRFIVSGADDIEA